MEFRLEPRSDDRSDRTRAHLSRPSRHSKDNSRARLSLGSEEPEDRHGLSPRGPSGQSCGSPYCYRRASIIPSDSSREVTSYNCQEIDRNTTLILITSLLKINQFIYSVSTNKQSTFWYLSQKKKGCKLHITLL
ncbi:hypothetical protein YC2023_050654 [Brassica napus]